MAKSSRPLNVLLVEDNPVEVALVKGQLGHTGFHLALTTVATLEEGVQQVTQGGYDVVLLDLSLPDSQGLATFKVMYATANNTPIIVLTGLEDVELAVQALSDGAQDYLLKSKIDGDSLIRAIRYTVERARRQRAESELAAAGEIQRKLFPRTTPKVSGFDVTGRCTQATYAGGDFFDFFTMGHKHLGIVIADAAGNGIGPAITMSETRAVIRAFASVTTDVGEILTRAGVILARDLTKETFVALFLARLDVASRTLEYATAGHPGFILTSAGRTKQILRSVDPPLGIDRSIKYRTSRDIQLSAGDSLFLFTDGFAESRNPDRETFGKQRVFEAIRQRYDDGATAMLDHLFDQVREFQRDATQQADITAIVVKTGVPVATNVNIPNAETKPPSVAVPVDCQYFDIDVQFDISVIRIREEEILSSKKCTAMKNELIRYLESQESLRMVICFGLVQRFSSQGIDMFFHAKSITDAQGGQIRLCEMNARIREAFKALNLDGPVFEIHDDVAAALESF